MNKAKKRQEVRPIGETDYMVPVANRLFRTAAKSTWRLAKFMGRIAVRIPGWFLRTTSRDLPDRRY